MFGWLKRKWRNRGRAIFRFWDGMRERVADPLVIHRALMAHPEFNWETTPALIDVDDDKISTDAIRVTADGVRSAFGVPSLEAGGLTEMELVHLLVQFTSYLADLKKSIGSPPTSPEPTGSAPSGTSTTRPASDSGSTHCASRLAEATAFSSP